MADQLPDKFNTRQGIEHLAAIIPTDSCSKENKKLAYPTHTLIVPSNVRTIT
jgi:hypothetical protein